ncbi:MAG TPA: peptide chain release factor N(5)-glutamine methyltransferase [Anaerolineales bacterium]|nr:peptide chain release factor N(5)-glutamine methyltransferase [Anaerolineales bacterium]
MTSKIREDTVGVTLDGLFSRLEKVSDTPGLDAQVLLARLLDRPRSWVLAHPDEPLAGDQLSALDALVRRLEKGEPLPYVLGRWEFFGLEFEVSPDVLIPRPETELMVERAIAWLQTHPGKRRAVDVGTGSGCVGIVLAANVPDLQVLSTDISAEAVDIARRNARKHAVESRLELMCCDLVPPERHCDLLVANLPYIPTRTLHGLPIFGREPTLALDGGVDGLDLIRRLLLQAPDQLDPGGLLLMEIEASEGPAVLSLACDIFTNAEIHLHKDLAGHERLLEVQV